MGSHGFREELETGLGYTGLWWEVGLRNSRFLFRRVQGTVNSLGERPVSIRRIRIGLLLRKGAGR